MIDRRQFNAGLAGATALAAMATPLGSRAIAEEAGLVRRWAEYRAIVADAERLGIAAPKTTAGVEALGAEKALPAFSDLLAMLERATRVGGNDTPAVKSLVERAGDLLAATVEAEAAPGDHRLSLAVRSATVVSRPRFEDIAGDYELLFRTAEIRPEWRSNVAWYVSRLTDPEIQTRYQKVAEATCIPWFVIGIIHGMEAAFNFQKHLHNGDSLSARTMRFPPNRPEVWDPPNDWETSATDALQYDKLDNQEDWSLARTLYRWESYNGFRSRTIQKINTPYLWSFSNHYTTGKYVADGVWDGNAVSKQCGAAVMLKELVRLGVVRVPNV